MVYKLKNIKTRTNYLIYCESNTYIKYINLKPYGNGTPVVRMWTMF